MPSFSAEAAAKGQGIATTPSHPIIATSIVWPSFKPTTKEIMPL